MKNVNRHHDKSIIQHIIGIGFYTFISYLMAIIFSLVTGDSLKSIYFGLLFIICASISFTIYTVNTFFIGDTFFQLKPFKRALFILGDVLLCTLAGLVLAQLLIIVFISGDIFYLNNINMYIGSFIIAIIISTIVFVYYVLQSRIIDAQEIIHQSETEKIQLAKLKAEMELELLQGKLNPHFLFNSLNSVASLIRINPESAEKMTLQLADLFRALIDSDLRTMHSIDEEFSLLESYLKIEKIRYGDRLQYRIKNEVKSDIIIPKLILQPLVENSIQHAISINKLGGKIEISAHLNNNKLALLVADSGPGFDLAKPDGYGLKHVVDRLKLIYPNQFKIDSLGDPLFTIRIQIELDMS